MKRIRIMVCLVAAIAVSVVGVSVASATEFTTKAAIGGAAPSVVKIHSILAEGYLEAQSGITSRISCKGGTSDGEVTGPKTVENVTTTFTGCTVKSGEAAYPCENKAASEPYWHGTGIIKTETLKGTLGELENTLNSTTNPAPGIRFEEQNGGMTTAVFGCAYGNQEIEVKGTIIASLVGSGNSVATNVIPAAISTNTFAQKEGIQKYAKFVTKDSYEDGGCTAVVATPLCTGAREWQTPNPGSPVLCKSPLTMKLGCTGIADMAPYPVTNKQGSTCLIKPAYGCVYLSGESMIAKQESVPRGNLGVTK